MTEPRIDYRFRSVTDITVDDLHKMGAEAVGLDIDNTICLDGSMTFIDGLENWIDEVQKAGIQVMIITNAIEPRPGTLAKRLKIRHVSFARKPSGHKLKKAARMMNVDISKLAMIGDQLFADIKAANRCGAIAVRVDPIEGEYRFERFYARRRKKEAPILAEFEKTHGYGVER